MDRVIKLWEGLGYYTRARNLHKAAKLIAHECGGAFPETAKDLQQLPGVGPYTAAAIASIAFGQPAAVLDGNVMRVLSRLRAIQTSIDEPKTKTRLWALAQDLVSPTSPGDFNQGMMELGATVCIPRAPRCGGCPIAQDCLAKKQGLQQTLPLRTPKKQTPRHEEVIALIKRNGRYLVSQRPDTGLLPGLWEFPSFRVQSGETHDAALVRGLYEEYGLQAKPGGLAAVVKHAYSHFKVTGNAYACSIEPGAKARHASRPSKWLTPNGLNSHALPKLHLRILAVLLEEARRRGS